MSTTKLLVVGSPGSGKTTFARRLSASRKLTAIELDEYLWAPHWRRRSKQEASRMLKTDIDKAHGSYIVEGYLISRVDPQIHEDFDGIIFLDLRFWRTFPRAIVRNTKKLLRREKTCGDNYTNPLSILVFGVTTVITHIPRRMYLKELVGSYKTQGLEAYVFTTNDQANSWLEK